jgi:hypothetical protein
MDWHADSRRNDAMRAAADAANRMNDALKPSA